MRNLKRALSLALASVMVMGLMVVGTGASYKDVTSEHNAEAIEVLQAVGIMVGDDNGNFNPEANVTRNEMAVIMSNLMDYRVASYAGTSPFTDVPSWAEPYVAACWTNGITAGYTATTYGGSDTVTTSQAALMTMKALGYFQYQSDFEDDWQLATVKQANKIDLFEDVDSGVREAMTRNDVAQLVLNTLEAGTVEADDNTIKVNTGGTSVEAGKVNYNFVTSSREYAEAIGKVEATSSTSSTKGFIVELGEKLYSGDLTKDDDKDTFGRPASIWEYQAKEIGTYAKEADYTFTSKVTAKSLYNKIGATAAKYPNWSVSVNGDLNGYDGDDLIANRIDDDACFLRAAYGNTAQTGNGVLTQVYVDGTDRTVDIAVIHYYVAEVLKVDADEGTIALSDLDNGPAKASDLFDATDFEEDQIVVYSFSNESGDIESVYATEMMEGDVTRVRVNTSDGNQRDGDSFDADGTTYKYNYTMSDNDKLQTENVNNNVVAYMDPYGYIIYIDESAMTYDYAYVLSMGNEGDKYGTGLGGNTVYARLVLTDGTVLKVETDAKNESLENHIVSYSKDKNDVYTLTDRSGSRALAAANDLKVENGVASFRAEGGRYYTGNSNTVFVVADPDPDLDDYEFSVYTGIKNVPDIDGTTGVTKAVVATGNNGIAKVVFIEDAKVSGLKEVFFLRADSSAKLDKDSSLGNYFVINAVVDGETTTLKVKEGSRAAEKLVTDIAYRGTQTSGKIVVAADSITTNADGLVTNVSLYTLGLDTDGDGSLAGTGTDKAETGTVGLGGTRYGWTDDVVVVKYDRWNNFSVERINSIKKDRNDNFLATLDSRVLTGVCYMEVAGGEGTVATYDLAINGSGAGDITNLNIAAGADAVDGDSVITFTVPSTDYTVSVTNATKSNVGRNYTVKDITGNVTITVVRPAGGAIDDNLNVVVSDTSANKVTGFVVTDAHIITAGDNVALGSKYAGMNVGDMYIAFTIPSGVTLSAAADDANVTIGNSVWNLTGGTGNGTAGSATLVFGAAAVTPTGAASASSVKIEVLASVSALTETVTYSGVPAGYSVAMGSSTDTSLSKTAGADLKFKLNMPASASYMVDTKITYTLSGTDKDGTYTVVTSAVGTVVGNEANGPGNVKATGPVTVTVDKVEAATAVNVVVDSTVLPTGMEVTLNSSSDTFAIGAAGAAIPHLKASGLPAMVTEVKFDYEITGVTGKAAGDKLTETITAAVSGGNVSGAALISGTFVSDGTSAVTVKITGMTYTKVDDASNKVFNIVPTGQINSQTIDGGIVSKDGSETRTAVELTKNSDGTYSNKNEITVSLTMGGDPSSSHAVKVTFPGREAAEINFVTVGGTTQTFKIPVNSLKFNPADGAITVLVGPGA